MCRGQRDMGGILCRAGLAVGWWELPGSDCREVRWERQAEGWVSLILLYKHQDLFFRVEGKVGFPM